VPFPGSWKVLVAIVRHLELAVECESRRSSCVLTVTCRPDHDGLSCRRGGAMVPGQSATMADIALALDFDVSSGCTARHTRVGADTRLWGCSGGRETG
jgi:hypothetical protein